MAISKESLVLERYLLEKSACNISMYLKVKFSILEKLIFHYRYSGLLIHSDIVAKKTREKVRNWRN